nr:group II intron reverse transcriptase/maturase [Cryptomonas borealis]
MCTTSFEEQWKSIEWVKTHKMVLKAQKKIYNASKNNKRQLIIKYQKTLIKSWYARAISMQVISQNIQSEIKQRYGKYLWYKRKLEVDQKPKITCKKNDIKKWYGINSNDKTQTNYIDNLPDCAKQKLLLLAMEPEWEAKFEPNNYGIRPGRSARDAIEKIYQYINKNPKYLFSAYVVENTFPKEHTHLLKKINTTPKFHKQIKTWFITRIKHRIAQGNNKINNSHENIISPLLINIVMHGLENTTINYRIKKQIVSIPNIKKTQCNIIVCGDKFIIIHPNITKLIERVEVAHKWLTNVGISINIKKTHIVHSSNKTKRSDNGLLFLGFYIKEIYAKINSNLKIDNRDVENTLQTKLKVTPDKTCVKKHLDQLRDIIKSYETKSQTDLIKRINPICKKLQGDFQFCDNKMAFKKVTLIMIRRLLRWGYNRHRNKKKSWVKTQYFHRIGEKNWCFATISKNGTIIQQAYIYLKTRATKYNKIKKNHSFYDEDDT